MKPYAVVLGGGGGRGAYQIGVWSVLRKIGIRFNAVIGTSVGALNGALMVKGNFFEACKLWNEISLNDIVSLPSQFDESNLLSVKNLRTLASFRDKIIKEKGLDTEPLRRLINKYAKENVIRKRNIDFGMVTYNIKSFKEDISFLNEIPKGKLSDYLLASSALPGFKVIDIDGRPHLDGGLADNVPVSVAIERGYNRIIVVDLSAIGIVRSFSCAGTEIVYIKNSLPLGGILDFTQQTKIRNRTIGMLDALKVFGKIDGIRFFYHYDPLVIKKLDSLLKNKDVLKKAEKITGFNFKGSEPEEILRNNLPEKMRYYKYLSVPYLECAAVALGIEPLKIWTMKELINRIVISFRQKKSIEHKLDLGFFIEKMKNVKPFDILDTAREILPVYFLLKNHGGTAMKIATRIFPELLPAKIFLLAIGEDF